MAQGLNMTKSSYHILCPDYWASACDHLIKRDRIMRKLIPVYQKENIQLTQSPFQILVRIIVGQQISLKLSKRLWDKLQLACNNDIRPDLIGAFTEAELKSLGLSLRKSQYLLDAAKHFQQSDYMQADWWHTQDDARVISHLCEIKGVGRWTADMFLIFYLGRPDILPLDDKVLLRAISQHYFSGEPVSRFEAREVSQAWSPWRSVASWYLWRSLDVAAVEY